MLAYSDTSRRTFERAIELLKGKLGEPMLNDLRALGEQGKVHDPDAVIAVIHHHLAPSVGSDGN